MTLSFNNDPALKALHVAQAEQHAAQDMLVSGTYGNVRGGKFRGCSVGCFAHDIDPDSINAHATVADARGLPEWLIRLQDALFEGLPEDERGSFHVELAKRIPIGVDLDPLPHLIAIARIERLLVTQRAALSAGHPDRVTQAIAQVVSALEMGRRFHKDAAGVNGVVISAHADAADAASSMRSARSAAAMAWSATAWSSATAAWSAEAAASLAASSAARSAAWSAAAWSSATATAAWSSATATAAWIEERDALFASLSNLGA